MLHKTSAGALTNSRLDLRALIRRFLVNKYCKLIAENFIDELDDALCASKEFGTTSEEENPGTPTGAARILRVATEITRNRATNVGSIVRRAISRSTSLEREHIL